MKDLAIQTMNEINELKQTIKHLKEVNDAQSKRIKELEDSNPSKYDETLIKHVFEVSDERFIRIKELEAEIKQLKESLPSKEVYQVIGGEVKEGDLVVIIEMSEFPRVKFVETEFTKELLSDNDIQIYAHRKAVYNHFLQLSRRTNISEVLQLNFKRLLKLMEENNYLDI